MFNCRFCVCVCWISNIQLLTIIKSGVLALVGCTVFTAAFSVCVNPLCPLHRAIGSFRSVPMQNLALCLSKSPAEWNAMLQFRQINSPKPSISPTIPPYLTLKQNLDPNRSILKKIGIYLCWNVCLKWNALHLLTEGLFVGYNHLGKKGVVKNGN